MGTVVGMEVVVAEIEVEVVAGMEAAAEGADAAVKIVGHLIDEVEVRTVAIQDADG